MKKLYKSEQSGRSMVEMLGVLAIIGVLSVGGIAGYSKAMAKFKLTKAMDQLTMLLANIRTTYAGMQSYNGLTAANARLYGLAPGDMNGAAAGTLVNAFGGSVLVDAVDHNGADNSMGFAVTYNGLTKEACMNLATADWGMGIDGLAISAALVAGTPGAPTAGMLAADLPLPLDDANDACTSASDSNAITWFFY